MLNRYIVVLLILISFNSLIFCQSSFTKTYTSGIDGSIKFDGDLITFDILDFKDNFVNKKFGVLMESGISFLVVEKQKYLMLRSDDSLYLFSDKSKLLFNGISKSGKLLEFISPAKKYESSSFLSEKNKYPPENLSNVRMDKPWVEGVAGNGIGQNISMNWESNLCGIFLINGFISYKNPKLFLENNRVKKIRVFYGEKDSFDIDLADTPNPQFIKLPKYSRSVCIEIMDIFPGSKWNDTCLSMVHGVNYQAGEFFK